MVDFGPSFIMCAITPQSLTIPRFHAKEDSDSTKDRTKEKIKYRYGMRNTEKTAVLAERQMKIRYIYKGLSSSIPQSSL